ncbi:MAG: hypothetical protein QOC89_2574 [Paraburkholderia sp.]|jgi:hypothetical protein|nr:hypothetical protein [Paraburkholderia sp.]
MSGNQPNSNLVQRVSALTAACRLCVSCTWLPKDIRHDDAATAGFGVAFSLSGMLRAGHPYPIHSGHCDFECSRVEGDTYQ